MSKTILNLDEFLLILLSIPSEVQIEKQVLCLNYGSTYIPGVWVNLKKLGSSVLSDNLGMYMANS